MRHRSKSNTVDAKQLRSFGYLAGGVLLGLGLWPLVVRAESPRPWAIAVAGLLAVLGLVRPSTLKSVYLVWMRVGSVLGWVNTRLVLGAIFYGVLTPMALAMRVCGRDIMRLQFDPAAGSYRIIRTLRPASHLRRQF